MTAQGPTPNVPPPPVGPPPAAGPGGPADPAPSPARRGWRTPAILLPLAVSGFAVLLALVSLVVAAQAVSEAGEAKDAVASGRPADDPAERPAPAPENTQREEPLPADPTATGEPPELDERTNYDVEYEKKALTLEATEQAPMYVDVDVPQALLEADGTDLSLVQDYQGNEFIQLGDDVRASAQGERGMTPNDCYGKITSAPLGGERKMPVRQGNVLCVMTSFAAAQVKGDEWRIVRLEITGVGADGKVAVELTAWNIPR